MNGGELQSETGSGLTTSMWPLRISERPAAGAAGSQLATTLDLPATSQLNGAAPAWPASAAGSSGDLERLEAELGERGAHDRLPRGFVAEQRRRLDQLDQQGGHRRFLGGDRREDLGVHHREATRPWLPVQRDAA